MNGSRHEATPPRGAVTVSLKDLESGVNLRGLPCISLMRIISSRVLGSVNFETLEEAFGPTSLGIIVVKDVPARFSTLRQKLLSYASFLANLPSDELGSAYSLHAATLEKQILMRSQNISPPHKPSISLAGPMVKNLSVKGSRTL